MTIQTQLCTFKTADNERLHGLLFTPPGRNVQRLLKSRNPKVGEVKAEDVIDNRLMRKLDESGFIDKMYATYGAKL
jgi:hypothetical protein